MVRVGTLVSVRGKKTSPKHASPLQGTRAIKHGNCDVMEKHQPREIFSPSQRQGNAISAYSQVNSRLPQLQLPTGHRRDLALQIPIGPAAFQRQSPFRQAPAHSRHRHETPAQSDDRLQEHFHHAQQSGGYTGGQRHENTPQMHSSQSSHSSTYGVDDYSPNQTAQDQFYDTRAVKSHHDYQHQYQQQQYEMSRYEGNERMQFNMNTSAHITQSVADQYMHSSLTRVFGQRMPLLHSATAQSQVPVYGNNTTQNQDTQPYRPGFQSSNSTQTAYSCVHQSNIHCESTEDEEFPTFIPHDVPDPSQFYERVLGIDTPTEGTLVKVVSTALKVREVFNQIPAHSLYSFFDLVFDKANDTFGKDKNGGHLLVAFPTEGADTEHVDWKKLGFVSYASRSEVFVKEPYKIYCPLTDTLLKAQQSGAIRNWDFVFAKYGTYESAIDEKVLVVSTSSADFIKGFVRANPTRVRKGRRFFEKLALLHAEAAGTHALSSDDEDANQNMEPPSDKHFVITDDDSNFLSSAEPRKASRLFSLSRTSRSPEDDGKSPAKRRRMNSNMNDSVPDEMIELCDDYGDGFGKDLEKPAGLTTTQDLLENINMEIKSSPVKTSFKSSESRLDIKSFAFMPNEMTREVETPERDNNDVVAISDSDENTVKKVAALNVEKGSSKKEEIAAGEKKERLLKSHLDPGSEEGIDTVEDDENDDEESELEVHEINSSGDEDDDPTDVEKVEDHDTSGFGNPRAVFLTEWKPKSRSAKPPSHFMFIDCRNNRLPRLQVLVHDFMARLGSHDVNFKTIHIKERNIDNVRICLRLSSENDVKAAAKIFHNHSYRGHHLFASYADEEVGKNFCTNNSPVGP